MLGGIPKPCRRLLRSRHHARKANPASRSSRPSGAIRRADGDGRPREKAKLEMKAFLNGFVLPRVADSGSAHRPQERIL